MKYLGPILLALLLMPLAVLAQDGDKMVVPSNYRDWVFLTSSLDLNYTTGAEVGAGQMHMLDNVFVNPEAYQAFLKTGVWPDKTVLVKENRRAESAGTLSKRGWFQSGVMNLEMHVKDDARPGKWAFFVSADGKAAGTLRPLSATCYSCHQDHGAADTTFVQFYPTLFAVAKDKGTLSASYLKDSAAK